jgi:hypothetical protein
MKKSKDVEDLASRLSEAAKAPLVGSAPAPQEPTPTTKTKKKASVAVLLRLPLELFEKCDAEAVSRTKATGRGVSVQQVIVDKLTRTL